MKIGDVVRWTNRAGTEWWMIIEEIRDGLPLGRLLSCNTGYMSDAMFNCLECTVIPIDQVPDNIIAKLAEYRLTGKIRGGA